MSLNLADCLVINAEAQPAKVALTFEETRLTYGQLYDAAQRVANMLRHKDIGPGHAVAMFLPNVPQFAIIYYGILLSGAAVVPINCMLRTREICHQLEDSGADLFFVWAQELDEAVKAFVQTDTCRHLIVVEPGSEPQTPSVGESFVTLAAAASPVADMAQTRPDDTAVILYTSALDGRMRGAQLSHFNLFHNASVINDHVLRYYPGDVCLAVLPLFHSFGQTTMMNAPLLAGSSIVILPRFEAHRIFEKIQSEKITLLAMVPTMFHFLVHAKAAQQVDMTSLRAAITGGSAMPCALAEQFTQRFNIPMLEGYGLTETSPVVAFNWTREMNRPGSVGKPIWGTRVRIMRDDGSFCAAGETGEIVVRGPNVMKGYRNLPEINVATIRNGWLHTGDLGYLDADGYLFITGLKKNMIIRAGLNIYPREIELVLQGHPAIREAAVVGVSDAIRGQEVKALIVLEHGSEIPEKDLAAWCRGQLGAYKCPRKFEFVDALPANDHRRA